MKLLIAGGGTGGHVFPGIAVAQALKNIEAQSEIIFVGTQQGMEATLVPSAGFTIQYIKVAGLKGKGLAHTIKTLLRLPLALWQSYKILKHEKPHCVLGVGGYASGPLVIVAWMMRIPTAICEQNSIPGFTNRILARFVKKIFGSFAHAQQFFPREKYLLTGNPLRAAFEDNLGHPRDILNDYRILIVGGSLGARALNEVAPEAIELLARKRKNLSVMHQTGKNNVPTVSNHYRRLNINAEIVPFINDMHKALSESTVVLTRAGATTCFEIMATGAAAILVPYPHAIYDHQTFNAEELVENNAAIMVPEKELTPQRLATEIEGMLINDAKRAAIAQAARKLSKPHAAANVAHELLKISPFEKGG